jgi:hypothetical protein
MFYRLQRGYIHRNPDCQLDLPFAMQTECYSAL